MTHVVSSRGELLLSEVSGTPTAAITPTSSCTGQGICMIDITAGAYEYHKVVRRSVQLV